MGDKNKIVKQDNKGLVKSNGAPDFKKMQKAGRGQQISTNLQSVAKTLGIKTSPIVPLQVVLMFDITGSMFAYFEKVRQELQEIVKAVKQESPDAQFAIFAYRNHGDEDAYTEICYTSPLTKNIEEIFKIISSIKKGGGGPDALTCMEDCLHSANQLNWQLNAPKAIVIIGDQPPHGVIDSYEKCYKKINFRLEIDQLIDKSVKFFMVYCDNTQNQLIRRFYQATAEESGGKFLQIEDLKIIAELLIGICLKIIDKTDVLVQRLDANKQLTPDQKKKILMIAG